MAALAIAQRRRSGHRRPGAAPAPADALRAAGFEGLDATGLREAILSKERGVRETTEACLDAIEASNDSLGAFLDSPCVVASGSDATIDAIRRRLRSAPWWANRGTSP